MIPMGITSRLDRSRMVTPLSFPPVIAPIETAEKEKNARSRGIKAATENSKPKSIFCQTHIFTQKPTNKQQKDEQAKNIRDNCGRSRDCRRCDRSSHATFLLQILRIQDHFDNDADGVDVPAPSGRPRQGTSCALRRRREGCLFLQILRLQVFDDTDSHRVALPAPPGRTRQRPPRPSAVANPHFFLTYEAKNVKQKQVEEQFTWQQN